MRGMTQQSIQCAPLRPALHPPHAFDCGVSEAALLADVGMPCAYHCCQLNTSPALTHLCTQDYAYIRKLSYDTLRAVHTQLNISSALIHQRPSCHSCFFSFGREMCVWRGRGGVGVGVRGSVCMCVCVCVCVCVWVNEICG